MLRKVIVILLIDFLRFKFLYKIGYILKFGSLVGNRMFIIGG